MGESALAQVAIDEVDVELALLGTLLGEPHIFEAVAHEIDVDWFSDQFGRYLFGAMLKLHDDGAKLSPPAIVAMLPEDCGGMGRGQFFAHACASGVHAGAISGLIHTLKDRWARRTLLAAAEAISAEAGALQADPYILASDTVMLLDQISATRATKPGGTMSTAVQRLEASLADRNRLRGASTGLWALDNKLNGYKAGQLYVIAGRPGMGKAQPLTSQILTPSGFISMGDVQVGQMVARPDGSAVRIRQIHPQGLKPVYKVTFSDGRSARATGDHLWTVRMKGKLASESRTVTTEQMRKYLEADRHKGRTSVPLARAEFGTGISPEVDPYLVGLLLGDGRLGETRVTFCSADDELIDAVADTIPPTADVRREYLQGRTRHITIGATEYGNNPVGAFFRACGLMGCDSSHKFVPPELLTADRDVRLAVVQGLLDTDGTVEPSGTVRYSTVSDRLAEDFVFLVRSLGGLARARRRQTYFNGKLGKKAGLPSWIITVRHANAAELFRLARKKDRLPKAYQYEDLRLQVKSVEPDGEEVCQCITIDAADGLYITDDFVVTHNSAFMCSSLRRTAQSGKGVAIFSLEMTEEEIAARCIADSLDTVTAPFFGNILKGQLSDVERQDVARAADALSDLPLYIDDTARLTFSEIAGRARREKLKFEAAGIPLAVLCIDHMGLVTPSDRYRGNKVAEAGEVSGLARALAKELDCCVILLCQLSREVEKRDDKRPVMSDLRWSGEIEQDAHVIGFLYREAYYLSQDPDADPGAMQMARNALEFLIRKNRNGETGDIRLWCSIGHSSVRDDI